MIDQYGRKINYLRLSVTDRCNLRCQYCMPEDGIEKRSHAEILTIEEMAQITSELIELGIDKIRITGGEPLVRKGILSLIREIGANPKVKDLTLTTNGILLKEMASDLKAAGIGRVNVSLDSLNSEKYAHMTRGGDLQKVLEGIEEARKVGMNPIKLNVVLIGGFNVDEIRDFVNLTRTQPLQVRFIELMPIGEVEKWSKSQYVSNRIVLDEVPELELIEADDPSSPAVYYKLKEALGTVGLISPISCKFCSACNRIRLTSDGHLKYCLHSDEEYDLKKALVNHGDIKTYVERCVHDKPKEHHLENGSVILRNMVQIGG